VGETARTPATIAAAILAERSRNLGSSTLSAVISMSVECWCREGVRARRPHARARRGVRPRAHTRGA
jgi:hypothetical protein